MDRLVAGLLVSLMVATGAAGCLGDDDAPKVTDAPEAEEAVATAETGSITGQVVTNDLEVLPGVDIGLSATSGPVGAVTTDKQGRYTFNDLEPGRYRLQVAAACCRAYSKDVEVVANQVTEAAVQLTRLTQDDLRVPFVVEDRWDGFIACGVGAGGGAVAVCSITGDPNDDFLREFTVQRGLTELVVAMDWDPVGGVSGDEFNLLVENRPNGFSYVDVTGPAPLQASVTDQTTANDEHKFAKIEDEKGLVFRVFTGGNGLTYQQAFTVYWYQFYYHNMPAGFQTIPDS